MQTLKKFYFGKQKAKVNTYIGGIGANVNTPALLAAILGINVNRIRLFKVTGVDIECAIIGGSYGVGAGTGFQYTGVTYFIDTGAVASIKSQKFTGASSLERAIYPNAFEAETETTSGQNRRWTFTDCGNLKLVYIPRVTNILTTGQIIMFRNLNANCKIYCHPSLATANAGSPHVEIAVAIARGASIRYVTNFTPPNAVTNLSAGIISNTAIQLNFTPPASINGVDFYEVYLNEEKLSTREIKNSGDFITGLTQSINYNIRIVAVDMFYNKSELSNTVNAITTNTSLDVDASAYINASNNDVYGNIINTLFSDLKSQGLYSKIQAFYPFLGTTAAQHKWNAKNPLDTNAAFRLQFFGGGTHSNLGYQCNGTNTYANTFLVPSAVQNVNSNGLTVVVGTNNATIASDAVEIGSLNSVTQASLIVTKSNNTTFRRQSRMNGNSIFQDSQNDSRGIFTSVKQSAAVSKFFRNQSQIASGNSAGTLPNINLFIGTLNSNGSPYSLGWSSQRVQFAAIHEGLTDAEVVALHTIIDNFESAIGRKTW